MNRGLKLIVFTAIFTSLVNAGFALSQETIIFNAGTTFFNTSADQEMSLIDVIGNYRQCVEIPKPERREYETKSEYRERLSRDSIDCDSLIEFSGFLEVPVLLNYDVDTETFHLYLQLEADWYPLKGTEMFLRPVSKMDYPYMDEGQFDESKGFLNNKLRAGEYKKRNTHPIMFNKGTVNGMYFNRLLVDSFTHEFAVDEYWLNHRKYTRLKWDVIKLDLRLFSRVNRARELKAREGGLAWRIKFNYDHYGVFNRPTVLISEIEIVDTENIESLFKLSL
jgi:hypothetical protein